NLSQILKNFSNISIHEREERFDLSDCHITITLCTLHNFIVFFLFI
ncbi:hypothetical protein CARUB_v100247491mg, partial [Capsella rubella]